MDNKLIRCSTGDERPRSSVSNRNPDDARSLGPVTTQ